MNVSFVSLGCDKNRVNTEQMMALCLQARDINDTFMLCFL